MKKKLFLLLLTLFFILTPIQSRVHVRHVGPRPQQTEEEKEANDKRDMVLAVVGIFFFGALFYFGNKKK
jgi:hypothetical protein